jgi:subfamily B ATP-binding cassette protein MsbA
MLTGTASSGTGVQGVLDRVLEDVAPDRRVLALGIAILVAVALKNAISMAAVTVAGRVRARAVVELRRQLLESILHAPSAALERYTSGEITNVFLSEAWRVNRILDLSISLIHRGIIALSYLAALVILSWQLTIVTLGLGLVLALASQAIGRGALRHGQAITKTTARLARHVTETMGGMRIIRTTASEKRWQDEFAVANRGHAESDLGASLSQSATAGLMETLGIAGAMGLTAVAHQIWLQPGKLDVPAFLAFGFGMIRLLPALNQVYVGQAYITPLSPSVEVVTRWLDLPRYPARNFGDAKLASLEGGIRFDEVTFRYENGTEAVSDVSFFLPAGQTLAVLGASGSGKSTLASLLLRLREPKAGKIQFDDREHWSYEPESFSRAVALVEQDPFLFNASVVDNVTCGRPGISREAALEALRVVKLSAFVEGLPDGADTVVAERGSTMSGGQRQRLAIARAIVGNPAILILDEPTSALDPDTEKEVVTAIDAASAGRTTVIITHRESTVEHAHLRLYLANGRVTQKTGLLAGSPGSAGLRVANGERDST